MQSACRKRKEAGGDLRHGQEAVEVGRVWAGRGCVGSPEGCTGEARPAAGVRPAEKGNVNNVNGSVDPKGRGDGRSTTHISHAELKDEEPEQGRRGDGRQQRGEVGDVHLALRHQVAAQTLDEGRPRKRWNQEEDVPARQVRDFGVLAHANEELGSLCEPDGKWDGKEHANCESALEVHAKHRVLLGAIGLSADRLEALREADHEAQPHDIEN